MGSCLCSVVRREYVQRFSLYQPLTAQPVNLFSDRPLRQLQSVRLTLRRIAPVSVGRVVAYTPHDDVDEPPGAVEAETGERSDQACDWPTKEEEEELGDG